ncbi:hypothetical protein BJ508DRAFT_311184 [Ascobolus immersus RN42]|uniref:Uncharacterized protein n=1 Tax=Ascobolus immersus RN42 TaxID=1160509 RepID=A0A3N4HRM5_ASCIM|nr:hypothetical protein BJ508DRAFT_311184 [Ascobolus immersus RN42]
MGYGMLMLSLVVRNQREENCQLEDNPLGLIDCSVCGEGREEGLLGDWVDARAPEDSIFQLMLLCSSSCWVLRSLWNFKIVKDSFVHHGNLYVLDPHAQLIVHSNMGDGAFALDQVYFVGAVLISARNPPSPAAGPLVSKPPLGMRASILTANSGGGRNFRRSPWYTRKES